MCVCVHEGMGGEAGGKRERETDCFLDQEHTSDNQNLLLFDSSNYSFMSN